MHCYYVGNDVKREMIIYARDQNNCNKNNILEHDEGRTERYGVEGANHVPGAGYMARDETDQEKK